MRKDIPQVLISEEDKFKLQFQSWLNDSHYWNYKDYGVAVCEWCYQVMPLSSEQSSLCIKNPEILKISNK